MHAINAGSAGKAWAALAAALPKPRAILMATAHWETQLPMVSGNPQPSMIYDFGGFSEDLYKIRYSAPGDPQLAARAQSLLKAAGMTAGIDGCRGLDHGTWVPLLHLYPAADIPVVQLAVQPTTDPHHHLEMGRALSPLRGEGVLIVGSGHLTHNLRDWMMAPRTQERASYAQEFQEWVKTRLDQNDVDGLIRYRRDAPHAVRAHPTEEHFLPLFVALGAAGSAAKPTRVFDGFEGSALAMDAYRFD